MISSSKALIVTGFVICKSPFKSAFHLKHLGPLTYFLGLEVQQSRKGLFLHQHKYATDLIDLAGQNGATPVDTPLEVNVKLRKDDGDLLSTPPPSDS